MISAKSTPKKPTSDMIPRLTMYVGMGTTTGMIDVSRDEQFYVVHSYLDPVSKAGILARSATFHRFIEIITNEENIDESRAADFIRHYCGIKSRAEIKINIEKRKLFNHLFESFVMWVEKELHDESAPARESQETEE